MKFSELCNEMRKFNEKHGIKRKCEIKYNTDGDIIRMDGCIIISDSRFANKLPLEKRTYYFDNYNKALTSDDLGYSIFARCDADDDLMRIERLNNIDVIDAWVCEVIE